MSIPVGNLSLLAALSPLRQRSDNNGVREGVLFAGKLDKALGSGETSSPNSVVKAKVLAESLTLKMMQSSIDLAGDSTTEDSPVSYSSQFASLNSFLQAYHANSVDGAASPLPSAKPYASQLHELTGSISADVPSGPPTSLSDDGTAWLDPIISKASRKYGVEAGLIRAVIKAESDFNPQAVSHAGASGLMQLMPATARSLGVTDSFDPEQNVMAGTRFLKDMIQRYGGNVDAALAAYNWGPGNVDRRPDHLPRETREYLARVKALYTSYNG